jgi:hypothetical protein
MTNKIVPWGRCKVCKKIFPITDLHDRGPGKFVGVCERCMQPDHEQQIELHEEVERGLVYFVRGELSGLIKIGYTTHLNKHFKTLQTCSGEVLTLLATQSGAANLELELQSRFARDRVRDEWYIASKELLEFIGELL